MRDCKSAAIDLYLLEESKSAITILIFSPFSLLPFDYALDLVGLQFLVSLKNRSMANHDTKWLETFDLKTKTRFICNP